MIITNDLGLPESFVNAVKNDPYYKGTGVDYSVSELIAPVQQVILKQRYWDKLTEDASDGVWKLLGKAVHYILDKGAGKNELHEERLVHKIMGKKVSGAFDLYSGMRKLSDYKVTSAWSAVYGSRVQDWTAQLNLYAYLLRQHGYPVEELEVIAIYRDWSKGKANDLSYPQKPVDAVNLKLWDEESQRKYLELKVKNLIIAENDKDEDLNECSEEQMWSKPNTWAIMKPGRKSAVKVYTDELEFNQHLQELANKPNENSYGQKRPGARTRCENYCPVRDFCHQYKRYKETQETPEEVMA